MGMNHYIKTGKKKLEHCYACGFDHEVDELIHVGKSSIGRYYTLHLDKERGLYDLETWKKFIEKSLAEGAKIVDETGDELTYEDLLHSITRDLVPNNSTHIPGEQVVDAYGHCHGDIYGEKGLIYAAGKDPGTDGLYVMLDADFS